MTRPSDKQMVLETLRTRLADRLDAMLETQKAAQAGATHSEAKQEHPKDTRAIEQQYLARGLSQRVETLREAVAALNAVEDRELAADAPVQAGALVGICDEDDRELTYLLAPAGGGERIEIDTLQVVVVTPRSPLGESLLGAHIGDELEIDLGTRRRSVVVAWLR